MRMTVVMVTARLLLGHRLLLDFLGGSFGKESNQLDNAEHRQAQPEANGTANGGNECPQRPDVFLF